MGESSIQPDQMTYNAAMNLFAKVTESFRCFRCFFCSSYVKEDLYKMICVERILSIEALPGSWVASGSAVAEWYAYQLAGARRSEFPNNQRRESLQTIWQRVLSKICKKTLSSHYLLHFLHSPWSKCSGLWSVSQIQTGEPCQTWSLQNLRLQLSIDRLQRWRMVSQLEWSRSEFWVFDFRLDGGF